MSFIRPELRDGLVRWREVIIATGAAGFGLLLYSQGGYVFGVLGILLMIGGGAGVWVALRRMRFAADGSAPGLVEIDEGRITYLGPYGGGVAELDLLTRILINHDTAQPGWVLHSGDGSVLTVPLAAEGAEALFDALSALPGFSARTALRARSDEANAQTPVWSKDL
ncbi:hypothetical protein [Actibacterium sp. 188UL27-1]|uniref:hypothetical protein n=1 Tax=Actibacterium sp. 188UL27-1 TaxID=2786961 RepID=UPI00195B72C7|nr:hypothetical protein [Actibacterium sp. 188UL27-1]MBM7066062.1 hypothetical protein [Actibacterium sp. 188UL27-1]